MAKKGWLIGILCLILALSVTGSIGADDGERTYPIMHPDRETLHRWIESYNAAPLVHIDLERLRAPSPRGSYSVLSHLQYTPAQRDQGYCGNCWTWAGTGCLGIALDVQESILDRLSIQYLNSNYTNPIRGLWACCGGWLSDLAAFYTVTKKAIPWSNTNANWQDGGQTCAGSTTVPASTIATAPNYPITSIDDETIETQTVSPATAIANIKNVLDGDKAVWFAFFLPNSTAWSDFFTFWSPPNDEDVIYDIDQFCDILWEPPPSGGGHAVLCVGYNDEAGTDNDYWIMLNSWGTGPTNNRPHGLFRITMDMNYDGTNPGLGDGDYSFYWQSLDVTFGTRYTVTFDTSPTDTGTITFAVQSCSDGDTVDVGSGTYDITANPSVDYVFTKWEVTGDIAVVNSTLAVTACTVTGAGTLRMVQECTSAGEGKGGGTRCFIATAIYTDNHPIPSPSASYGANGLKSRISTDRPITVLYKFRDEYLLTNALGKIFVSCYEGVSPLIAGFIQDKEPFKAVIRHYLRPVIWLTEKVTK